MFSTFVASDVLCIFSMLCDTRKQKLIFPFVSHCIRSCNYITNNFTTLLYGVNGVYPFYYVVKVDYDFYFSKWSCWIVWLFRFSNIGKISSFFFSVTVQSVLFQWQFCCYGGKFFRIHTLISVNIKRSDAKWLWQLCIITHYAVIVLHEDKIDRISIGVFPLHTVVRYNLNNSKNWVHQCWHLVTIYYWGGRHNRISYCDNFSWKA